MRAWGILIGWCCTRCPVRGGTWTEVSKSGRLRRRRRRRKRRRRRGSRRSSRRRKRRRRVEYMYIHVPAVISHLNQLENIIYRSHTYFLKSNHLHVEHRVYMCMHTHVTVTQNGWYEIHQQTHTIQYITCTTQRSCTLVHYMFTKMSRTRF